MARTSRSRRESGPGRCISSRYSSQCCRITAGCTAWIWMMLSGSATRSAAARSPAGVYAMNAKVGPWAVKEHNATTCVTTTHQFTAIAGPRACWAAFKTRRRRRRRSSGGDGITEACHVSHAMLGRPTSYPSRSGQSARHNTTGLPPIASCHETRHHGGGVSSGCPACCGRAWCSPLSASRSGWRARSV